MCINRFVVGLVLTTTIGAFVVSCANENQPYYTIPTVQLKGSNCLKGATEIVSRYMKGEAQEKEVEGFWDCASFAIKTFQEKVEGNNPAGYAATELRDFLERYFLGGNEKDALKIEDPLLKEIMEVKRLFVGGNAEFITRAELEKGMELIQEFRGISVRLLPHVRLIFYQNNGEVPSGAEVDAAAAQIETAFEQIGGIFAASGVPYDFARLDELLKQVDRLFKRHDKSDTFEGFNKYIPLVARIKSILLNSTTERILGGEWKAACSAIGRGFSLYLRGYFFLNAKSLFDLSRLDQFEKMGRMAVELFKEAFTRRNNEPIALEETDALIDEWQKIAELPFGLKVDHFKSMWRTVVDKILSGASKTPTGLALVEVEKLDVEFTDWLNIQRWLLGATGHQPRNDSLVEMQALLATPWPLSTDIEGRLLFHPDFLGQWNVEAMSRMNWLRALFRLVVLAYTQDPMRRDRLTGLDKSEFDEAYADLKPFLVALGLIEDSNTTFGERVMREAGLFTSRGNGDAILNFKEVVEYVHYVLSGIDTGELFVERVAPECPVIDDAIQAPCFRAAFRKYFNERYAHLPLMVSYASTLDDKGWSKMIKALELANREEGAANTPVKTSDIYEMGILLQYIETVMLRFDVDLNGAIDLREGLAALPLFENVLAEFAGMDPKKDAKDIRAIFTYMLKYGEPPDKKNILSLLRYLWWRMNEKSWKVNADRGVILQILSSLSSL